MTPELAKELLKFVNDPWVLEDLTKYKEARIQKLYKKFEVTRDEKEFYKLQGAIEELRRFDHLREEIRAKAEGK